MGKFCSKCGAPLNEDAAFCSGCGAKQITASAVATAAPQPTVSPLAAPTAAPAVYNQASKNNSIVGIIAVAAIAIIVIVLIIFGCVKIFGGDNSSSKKSSNGSSSSDSSSSDSSSSSGSFETPLSNICKGLEQADWDKFSSAFPKSIVDKMKDEFSSYDAKNGDEFMKSLKTALEEEYGKNLKVTYKIESKEKLTKDEISDIEESYESNYDEKITVSEGYSVTYDTNIKGDDNEDSENKTTKIVKIGSKWYDLDDGFMNIS